MNETKSTKQALEVWVEYGLQVVTTAGFSISPSLPFVQVSSEGI